jgi:hypothetical protein
LEKVIVDNSKNKLFLSTGEGEDRKGKGREEGGGGPNNTTQ